MSASVEHVRRALAQVVGGETLSEDAAYRAIAAVMGGDVPDALIGGLLTALRMRGETSDELAGAARAMRDRVVPVDHGFERVLDTCGTGGDGLGTFNISTTVAIVAAAAGVVVAKHGNRSVSSLVGSADVLAGLGVRIDLEPDDIITCLREVGIGFMFAPMHGGALKHAAPVRRQLGFRTMFNLLGPVTNPARASHQLLGMSDAQRLYQIAEVLARGGTRRALVVHGPEGMDELGLSGPSQAVLLNASSLTELTIDPSALGLSRTPAAELGGGDVATNVAIIRGVLGNSPGPARDVVLLNAGAALWVAEVAEDIAAGVALARQILASGAAQAKLESLVATTNRLRPSAPQEPAS